MNKMHYTDQDILEGVRLRSTSIVEYVYEECYPLVKSLVLKNSGELEDVQDVFQDAMVILYKKLRQEDLTLHCAFKTYFYSICNHLWLQKLQKRKKEKSIIKNFSQLTELKEDDLIEIYDDEAEKHRIYQKHFLSLEKECQNLLRLFLKKISLKEIAEIVGYKTEKYTKVKKFRCKEELKRRIINDPDYKNFF
jgi:RNA polymerase sigma factor (sigma-70 family)